MRSRLGSKLRDVVGATLFSTGFTHPRRAAAGRLTVVTFHRVLPQAQRRQYPLPGLAVTPEELEWFFAFFTGHFTCGTLGEGLRRWALGETPQRPCLAITFDDGQLDNFIHAKPLLERHGLRATFFVPVQNIERNEPIWHDRLGWAASRMLKADPGRAGGIIAELGIGPSGVQSPAGLVQAVVLRGKHVAGAERKAWVEHLERAAGGEARPAWDGMMTWDQLRQLVRGGHEIGSHSMTHAMLPQCNDTALHYEVAESRRELEARLGVSIDSFSYPNGDYDERIIRAVQSARYSQAVTTKSGTNRRADSLFRLRRCDMQADHVKSEAGTPCESRLAWRLSGFYPGLE